MDDCIFCKLVEKKIPSGIIFEDDLTIAFLDIAPVSKGHVLVIPKEHVVHLHELSSASGNALMHTIQKISAAVSRAFDTGYNILNNNGTLAGQAVHHVHFHIIPRRGEKNEFHFAWPASQPSSESQEKILELLKNALSS